MMIRIDLPSEVTDIFQCHELLGSGSQGMVFRVTKKSSVYIGSGLDYAMKIIKDETLDSTFRSELDLLSEIKNPYITNLDLNLWIGNTVYIFMDYYPNHDLIRVINDAKVENRNLGEDEILKFFIQACLGLEPLHSKKLFHKNIKLQNILLDSNKNVKLSDFGLFSVSSATSAASTPHFFSPRSCSGRPKDAQTKESDIWALGCVLYSLCNLNYPFNNIDDIKHRNYAPINSWYSDDLKALVNQCFRKKRKNRPTIFDILTNEFIVRKAFFLNIQVPNNSCMYPNIQSLSQTIPQVQDFREKTKNIQEKLNLYKEEIRINPWNANAYYKIGLVFYNEDRWEESLKYFDYAIKISPNGAYYAAKGTALYGLGRLEEALRCVRQGIKIYPDSPDVFYAIGMIFLDQKKYEESIKYFENAIRYNQNQPNYYYNRGNALLMIGRWEEAIDCYQQAIVVDPNFADAYNNIGGVFNNQNRFQDAINYFDGAIRADPNEASYYRNKGFALFKLDRIEESEICFDRAKYLS